MTGITEYTNVDLAVASLYHKGTCPSAARTAFTPGDRMRRATLFLVIAISGSLLPVDSLGGELFDSSQWKDHNPTAVGSVPFSDLMSIGNIDIGATVAYVDLFGSAESLSLYTANKDASGGIANVLGPPWLHLVATSTTPQPLNGGWTRFDFRDLKLVDIGFKFLDGEGPYFRVQNGAFSEVTGFEQHPGQEGSSVEYFQTLTGFTPNGSLPVYRVIWETLDAPYVSRQGDANRDGKVDLTDFGALKAGFGKHVEPWKVADFTGDGIVNAGDFDVLQQNFGRRESTSVPEPSSILLLGIGALTSCIGRRAKAFLTQNT